MTDEISTKVLIYLGNDDFIIGAENRNYIIFSNSAISPVKLISEDDLLKYCRDNDIKRVLY